MNTNKPDKKPGIITIKVSLPERVKILLKILAAKTQLTMSEFVSRSLPALERFAQLNGHHLFEDPRYSPAPPIAQILEGIDLELLATEIQLPVEKLEAIVAGEFPSDSDLSFLVSADCVPYSLPQLFHSRQSQFEQTKDAKNVHQ
ncbi:hypothetical protein QT972_09915 [Microcoleus sp. herbarium7]|uniref:hypothetical protein n=1 Tax=Microcoleus sp. herbarium7 TaxID=3055435 RepID=UPI002FCEFC9A